MPRLVVFLIGGLFWALNVWASEPTLLEEIVIRGDRQASHQQHLSIRQVRESSAVDFGEALNSVPGIEMVRKGPIAADSVLRGQQRDNINLLFDGTSLHGGCPSRMDPPGFHFDFSEVEQIDIVMGPYDLRYPGGLAGTVNAIPLPLPQRRDLRSNLTLGSAGRIHFDTSAGLGNERASVQGGYAGKYAQPYRSGSGLRVTEIYPETSPNRYRTEDRKSRAYDSNSVWLKSRIALSTSYQTRLDLTHQNVEHVYYPGLKMDGRHDRTDRIALTLQGNDQGSFLHSLQMKLWWNQVDHLMDDRWRESSRPNMMIVRPYMMETDTTTTMLGARIEGRTALGGGLLQGGIDSQLRNWDAVNRSAMYKAYTPQAMVPDVDSNNIGGYLTYTLPLTRYLQLQASARLDHSESEAGQLDTARLNNFYRPYFPGRSLEKSQDTNLASGYLRLTWAIADNLEGAIGIASNSRTPDPQELYLGLQRAATMAMPMATSWLGNPSLEAPRNNQADFGLKLTGERLFATLNLFYSRQSDYIERTELPDPDGDGPLTRASSYTNIDAIIYGGEIGWEYGLQETLFLLGDLALTRGENDTSGQYLAEMPPLKGSLGGRWEIGNWFLELREQFAARQNRVNADLSEIESPGWAVTNFKLGWLSQPWAASAGIDNLWDKDYRSHLSYQRDPFRSGILVPEPGRTFYFSLNYRY